MTVEVGLIFGLTRVEGLRLSGEIVTTLTLFLSDIGLTATTPAIPASVIAFQTFLNNSINLELNSLPETIQSAIRSPNFFLAESFHEFSFSARDAASFSVWVKTRSTIALTRS